MGACEFKFLVYALFWRLDSGTFRSVKKNDYIANVADRTCLPDNFVYLCLADSL